MADWAVLTDLDGTLLDHHSYDWHPAEPALRALRKAAVEVIAVTSKTAAEMPALLESIPYLSARCCCENGAVLVDGRQGEPVIQLLGTPQSVLIELYERVKQQHSLDTLAFHEVSAEQVATWTGLTLAQAQQAQQRHATLPIYWPNPSDAGKEALEQAAQDAGLQLLAGGRFLHLCGRADKGTALTAMRQQLGDGVQILALGDGGNDDAMLAGADLAIRIPPVQGVPRPEPVSGAQQASKPGPQGWNESVLGWLASKAR
ncbi:MAG: HAD-IIB family hydrolase [Saccharospirillum sp.]